MKGELRITEKRIAAEVLPKIQEAKKIIDLHYGSLRYLWITVDKKPENQFSVDCFSIHQIKKSLDAVERELCRI